MNFNILLNILKRSVKPFGTSKVTLQVGYHKVAQTQSQILSLEDQIQKQRDNIKNTLKIFEEQKTNHLDNTKELEKQLSDIAQKLRNAKAFYTESNLSNETNLIRKKQKETEEKILTVKADVETKKDKQLQWQQYFEEFKSNFMEGFTESFKQIVWKIFELENEIYNEEYLALKEQFEILKDRTNLTD
uniref:Uncharacterized protein n=1 Tax=Octopus bimaculoides TaxID=37653 RepID=A0A0L8I1V9_OCTBM